MSIDRPTRQELYDRIRSSSKDQVILEEMIRLGFYPRDGSLPEDPVADLQRMTELRRELAGLQREHADLHDVEALKRRAKRARMDAALERRKETKAKREQRRRERAARQVVRKNEALLHLGVGVSERVGSSGGTPRYGLPPLADGAALAAFLGIDVGELRWLAYHRDVSNVSHYRRFTIPKKTGGERLISAPMPRLKAAQHTILRSLLDGVPVHDAAHGFVKGRSIVTNARPHVGARIVVNLDLQDFFPTVTWVRVRGVFEALGYAGEVATTLALLCTETPVSEVELDGRTWFVATGPRVLPQGSPASPALTNILAWALDRRLSGLADKLGFVYTRYADDLTFSSQADDAAVGTLLKAVGQIVEDEGFVVHPDKTRVMRAGSRQEVTGLNVNDSLSVARGLRRQWKAAMFRLERDGVEAVRFGSGADPIASLVGFAQFVAMVTPEVGAPMVERVWPHRKAIGRPAHASPTWPSVQAASAQRRRQAVREAKSVLGQPVGAPDVSGVAAPVAGGPIVPAPPGHESPPPAPAPAPTTTSAGVGFQSPPPASSAPAMRTPDEPQTSRGTPDEPPGEKEPGKWWEFWRWFE